MSGPISEMEAQPVQPTAASTADALSASTNIEVDSEVRVSSVLILKFYDNLT